MIPRAVITEPAKGQTWRAKTPGRQASIILVDVGPRRVAFHGPRRQLRSIARETLHANYAYDPRESEPITIRHNADGVRYAYHPFHA